MVNYFEKLTQLFDKIQKGDYSVRDVFFDTVWINFSRLAHEKKAQAFLEELNVWKVKHAKAHPDFKDLITLSQGFIAFLKDQYVIANQLLDEAYQSFHKKNDEDGMAAVCICMGFMNRSKGDIDEAMKNGLRGLEQLSKSSKYKMFRIIGCYWVAGVYAETGHTKEALNLFKEAFTIDFPDGIRSFAPRIYNGMGGLFLKQKKFDLAYENFKKALELIDESSEKTFIARGLSDMGDYYFEMKNYPLATKYNLDALKIRRESKILNASITNLINLGHIYMAQSMWDEAILVLNEAAQIAKHIKLKVKLFPVHQMLSDIYLEQGHLAESLKQYKAFHEIKEEVNNEDLEKKVNNQVKLFEALQTEKENAIIKAQKIEIENEKRRSDELLYNILPKEVAEELKVKGRADAKSFDQVTVLFTDFKNFTGISETMTAKELVEEIHTCFKAFDEIIETYHIEKIKTIGDSYMCAGGLTLTNQNHAVDLVMAGLEIRDFIETHIKERVAAGKLPFQIRIGIHTGPVVAGIVGIKKFAYDIWGDTVNTASRMESSGEAGRVNISGTTYELVKNKFTFTHRGKIQAKGKGEIDMYFVEGRIS
jgi:adenylate cyclase